MTPTGHRVLALWEGRPDVPVVASLQKLLAEEAVPYLAAYRYKDSGLRKREAWEHTWELQRREDRGENGRDDSGAAEVHLGRLHSQGVLGAPWQARRAQGAVYPLPATRGRDTDPTPVLGWAGLGPRTAGAGARPADPAARGRRAGTDERLIPLVAGLAELLPWVQQWHADPDPFYGGVVPCRVLQ